MIKPDFSNKSNTVNNPHHPPVAHAPKVSCCYVVSQATHQSLLADEHFPRIGFPIHPPLAHINLAILLVLYVAASSTADS